MNEPTHIDLFSGIGGFALAAQWAGFRTVAFCEIDKYCQKILAKNFLENTARIQQGREIERTERERTWPTSEPIIHSNIFDLDGTRYRGCDLLTGGFPCQPFSIAGQRRGASDDRALWPQMFRVISEARPAWVLGENVPGIIAMELDNVLSDLEGIGYACRSFVIPACAVDARHMRSRVWIIGRFMGNAKPAEWRTNNEGRRRNSEGQNGERQATSRSCESGEGMADSGCIPKGWPAGCGETEGRRPLSESSGCRSVSDTNQQGLEGQRPISCGTGAQLNDAGDHCRWLPEPEVGRVAHGIPSRVDRLKGLGNAIVPQVAYEILREIRKLI